MYKKWRKYVPERCQNELYQYPGDAIMLEVAKTWKNKMKKKNAGGDGNNGTANADAANADAANTTNAEADADGQVAV